MTKRVGSAVEALEVRPSKTWHVTRRRARSPLRNGAHRLVTAATITVLSACPAPPPASEPAIPRAIEARLAPSSAHASCTEPSPGNASLEVADCGRVELDSSRGRELLSLSAGLRAEHAEARAQAVAASVALSADPRTLRRGIQALREMEAAAEDRSYRHARVGTALGALHHALARAEDDPVHLLPAYRYTLQALESAPGFLPALFNRALIEADLGLCRGAEESWDRFLAEERTVAWRREAERRRAALPCLKAKEVEPRDRSLDGLFTRAYESDFPAWLGLDEASAADDSNLLERMAAAGEVLARKAGDPFIAELAAELRGPLAPAHREALVQYARGYRLFRRPAYEEARRSLEPAVVELASHGSVVTPWCELWLGALDLYDGRFDEARARLDSALGFDGTERSPQLSGRIHWVAGLADLRSGRLEAAYERFARAEGRFSTAGYSAAVASVRTLAAEALAELGMVEESWRPRIRAMRVLQSRAPHFTLHNALRLSSLLAAEVEEVGLAKALVREDLRVARDTGQRVSEIEARITLAEVSLELGEAARAAELFEEVLGAALELEGRDPRRRFLADIRLGLWLAGQPSPGASSEIDEVIRYFSEAGPSWHELDGLRAKAVVQMRWGAEAEVRATFDRALSLIRRMQGEIHQEPLGLRHWEAVQEIFDEAIRSALAAGEPVRALNLLEQARRPEMSPDTPLPFTTCQPASEVKPEAAHAKNGSVVISFGVVGDEIVWWRAVDGDCTFGRLPAPPVRAASEAVVEQALHRGLDLGSLEDLYERLLAEPLSGIDRERHLVLVPDRFLLRIPFAALRDPGSGRLLVEDRGISFASTFTEALRDPREGFQERRGRPWSALVVGDPAFDRGLLPWLSRLPGALDEAEAVHGLYGDSSRLLFDEEATSEAVRHALAGRQVLHLAAHALPSVGDAGGALVLARSADGKASGLTAGDELLGETARELDLVILSACSTLGTVPSRSGGLLGLARPFLQHGVSAVLGTLWPADDESTADFMIAFHQGLKGGLAASDALRRAQLAALEGESEDECCAWAAFQLIGDVPGRLPSRSVH